MVTFLEKVPGLEFFIPIVVEKKIQGLQFARLQDTDLISFNISVTYMP